MNDFHFKFESRKFSISIGHSEDKLQIREDLIAKQKIKCFLTDFSIKNQCYISFLNSKDKGISIESNGNIVKFKIINNSIKKQYSFEICYNYCEKVIIQYLTYRLI